MKGIVGLFNKTSFVLGGLLCITAIDGWFQAACVGVGIALLGIVKFDYSQSIAHRALWSLTEIHQKLAGIRRSIDREWQPAGGYENEAKRVILAEIHDLTPSHVHEIINGIQPKDDK